MEVLCSATYDTENLPTLTKSSCASDSAEDDGCYIEVGAIVWDGVCY
jgi:hypothetical protein